MENLPIDTKSLPSRIFYSEEEDKVYVGEPGDYKEIGGDITLDDIVPPTANQFLVGNSDGTAWEKRGLTGSDLVDSPPSSGVRLIGVSFTTGAKAGYPMSSNPSTVTSTVVQWSPGGVLKGNNAVASNDLVPLGQLEGMLSADNIDYNNTASGLLAETIQEAVDELVENIVNSNIKEVNGNYTILDTDRGKTIFILGNDRVITLPNTLTDKFSVTIKCMGTGATLVDSNGIIVGIPTTYTSPYDIPEFGVVCLTKITSGIDLTGDIL